MRKQRIKRRKSKSFIPLFLIAILSIGYAVITTVLDINGKAHLTYNTWDVHFENLVVKEGSVTATVPARIVDKTGIAFDATLTTPTDYYEFTFDVVNAGTIDAMVGSVNKAILTTEQSQVFDLSITYASGRKIKPNDALCAGDRQKIKVTLKCKDGVTSSQLENTGLGGIPLDGSIEYVKADENAIEFIPPIMKNIGYDQDSTVSNDLKSYYPNLATVILNDSINVPEGAPSWDISEAGNGGVMAYVVPNSEDSTKYDLHLEGDEGISAPVNSENLFFLNTEYSGKTTFKEIKNLSILNTSQTTIMDNFFYFYVGSSLDLSSFDTSNVTSMRMMFSYCSSLTELNVGSFDTSNVTSMAYMFDECSKLTGLDLSNFDTTRVTLMYSMFQNCSGLTSLDLSSFDTSNLEEMSSMFSSCKNLISVDLSSFNVEKVTKMGQAFVFCYALKSLDLSNFKTTNATYMSQMFYGCKSLVSLDISNFDTSNTKNLDSMFENCSSLKNLDLSSFNTSRVTQMSHMFENCSSLESLNLSNFYTSNVTNMSSMFRQCSSLVSIDLRKANFSYVTSYTYMLDGVPSGINIIVKDATAKSWIADKKSDALVKTVAEL